MANEKRLIDANAMREDWIENGENEYVYDTNTVLDSIDAQPTIDAVELPQGRPGDYLEWDIGVGLRQFYAIESVMICEDCMRYGLTHFAPVVDHANIVRIVNQEEMEKILQERREKAKLEKEELTLTVCGERKDHGK